MNGQPDNSPLIPQTPKEQAEIDKDFQTFWLPIVKETNAIPILGMNLEQIKRELFDWHTAMEEVSKVYCEITGGMLSYPTYRAESVIGAYLDNREKEIEEAIDDFREEQIEPLEDEIASLKDKLRKLQRQLRTRRVNKKRK